jgi:hypothetical protein
MSDRFVIKLTLTYHETELLALITAVIGFFGLDRRVGTEGSKKDRSMMVDCGNRGRID